MRWHRNDRRGLAVKWVGVLSLVALSLLGIACDTDSPTAPVQTTPTAAPVTSAVWNITVTGSPSTFELPLAGTGTFTTVVSVVVRRADNNQAPPNGSTAILSTGTSTVTVPLQAGAGQASVTFTVSAAGSINFQASFEGSTGQGSVDVVPADESEVPVPLFIEQILPTQGSPVGGERVRVLGTGFEEPTRVFFGSQPGIVKSVSPTVIVVETPFVDLAVGTFMTVAVRVDVNVNEEGTSSDTLLGAYTFTRGDGGGGGGGGGDGGGGALVPRIISVTPTSGPNEGGTEVTIRGEGFSNQVQMFFGTATLVEAQVLDVTSERIVALTPAATGFNSVNRDSIVSILVRNTDSGFEDTLSGAFQYGSVDGSPIFISALSPGQGLYTGGDIVSIFGSGFEGPVAVTMGTIGQFVLSTTGTEIVVRSSRLILSSCSDVSGAVSVTNIETGASASGPPWTYRVFSPGIGNIDPVSAAVDEIGSVTSDRQATITGNDFDAPVLVNFGGISVSGTVISPNEISVTIPSFPGTLPTETCDDNMDGVDGTRPDPLGTAVNLTLTNQSSGCTSGEFTFRYTPELPLVCDEPPPLPPPPPEAPVASFSITFRVVDPGGGGEVRVTDTSQNASSLTWEFGDFTPLQQAAPGSTTTHFYTVDGTFTISLTVLGLNGDQVSTTQTVTLP